MTGHALSASSKYGRNAPSWLERLRENSRSLPRWAFLSVRLYRFLPLLFKCERNYLDWFVDNRGGRTRIFGIRCGGGTAFFIARESADAFRPNLLIGHPDRHGNIIRVEIHNQGGSACGGTYGRVTIESVEDDVVSSGTEAYITKQDYTKVENANVAWAKNEKDTITIPTKQSEILMIARLQTKVLMSAFDPKETKSLVVFNIASEKGFGPDPSGYRSFGAEPTEKSRVYLIANKKYNGILTVGGHDVEPKEKKFELFEKDGTPYLQLVT